MVGHDSGALGCRVDSVALVQVRTAGDAVEQKWQKRRLVVAGHLRKDLVKPAPIVRAHVGRAFHPRQQDLDVPLAGPAEDLLEVLSHLVRRQPPEGIVATERHDQDPHVAIQRPVEAAQSASARVAGHAGVHHFETIAGRVDALLKHRRIGLGRGQPQPGREAVAESDDPRTRGGPPFSLRARPQRPSRRIGPRGTGVVAMAAGGTPRQYHQGQHAGDRSGESCNQRLSIILARQFAPRTETVSAPLLVCLLVLLALGGAERLARDRALRAIPIRIHVNGTRAKSTVTRLIWSALTEAGVPTIAKTTGTAARLLLPDRREIPLRRVGPASIREQLEFLRHARRAGARAAVVECMALEPTLQYVAEHAMVRATIGVITNVRSDHTEVMGRDLSSIAATLANTIPARGVLVTGASRFAALFQERAADLGTRLVVVDSNTPGPSGEADDRARWLVEDTVLALAVTRELGIDDAVAERGFAHVPHDPGMVNRGTTSLRGGEVTWIDATAANDPESLAILLEDFVPWHAAQVGDSRRPARILIYHHRSDRAARLECFARHCRDFETADELVISGPRPPLTVRRGLRRARASKAASLLMIATPDLAGWLAAHAPGAALVFCGNTRGLDVPRLLEETASRD